MNKKLNNIQKIFFNTNKQRTLQLLAQKPTQALMVSEIIRATKISKAGASIALRELVNTGFVQRTIKGRTHLYQIDFHNPLVKQFKVIKSIVKLCPLIERLQKLSQQIILFGSASRGENLEDSDIDLFILTRNEGGVRRVMESFGRRNQIKAVVKNSSALVKLERADPTFYQEINRGIILYE